jgi:hypothetical protein
MSTAQEKTHRLRREMVLKQVIDSKQDELVQLAASAVKLLEKNGKMQTSQLRNLLNVSLDTPSTDVVISFICYQIARNKEAWGTGKKDFGHTVIMMLQDEITNLAKKVTKEVEDKMKEKGGPDVIDHDNLLAEVQTQLVRLYLGYLHRWFYFLDKSDDKREAVNTMLHLSKPEATPRPTGGTS